MSYLSNEPLEQLRAIRQDIHAHPECASDTRRTAGIVAEYLRQCRVDEVHENIGGYGVVGIINGKKSGKSIALRADMDALPMQEIAPEGVERPYISVVPESFHGCGHDGHTVMLLGATRYLAEHKDFAGRVVLVFQPAEETLKGAREMLDDGLLERFPFEEIYSVHNFSDIPLGHVVVNEGPALSGGDNFTIRIQGKGSHGATPHLSIDPIVIASSLVMNFQTIVSRNVPPLQSVALSFGEISGGASNNIIPDSLQLRGTLRTYNEGVRSMVRERMQALVDAAAAGFACKISLEYTHNCPPTINDANLARELYQSLKNEMGEDRVRFSNVPQTPSEDFAFYLEHVKGVYAFIGQESNLVHHHPNYDFNDELIPYGVDFWIRVAHARLPLQP